LAASSFGELWLETALEIDHGIRIHEKRPWLDQMALAVAAVRSGLRIETLSQDWNNSVNNKQPYARKTAKILHYHGGIKPWNLQRAGFSGHCDTLLKEYSPFASLEAMRSYFNAKYPVNPHRLSNGA